MILGAAYRRIYCSINYRMRDAMGGRLARFVRPTSILLVLTNRCNARCVHCDIWKNRGQEDSLTLDEWKGFLSDLRRWLGPVQIHMTGGEALLRPYSPDLAAFASSLGFRVAFLTNGYWKDQERIERLARARPALVTISLDAVGEVHSEVRGREGFWETTHKSIQTLRRVREEEGLDFTIRLTTVIMQHNLEQAADVAQYARSNGLEVNYQPVEQNYNTEDDPRWFEHSPTWPKDSAKAVAVVDQLLALKRQGFPIVNTEVSLDVMRNYFAEPDKTQDVVQAHVAHERKPLCASLGDIQIEPNGDILTCCKKAPVGNLREESIRKIWAQRPPWWESGCCLEGQTDERCLEPVETVSL